MSEIEKMYKTAKVVPSHHYCNDCQYNMSAECPIRCPDNVAVYPPFTAEKQLELLKLLIRHYKTEIYCRYANDKYKLIMYTEDCCTSDMDSFESVLASVVCDVWGLLSAEEKQQVKGILE